jgi:hypothetical protein
MKIKITDFAKRHFDFKFGGTKILDYTVEEFEKIINDKICYTQCASCKKEIEILDFSDEKVTDGYASFCKLVAIKNFTDARVGSLPITLENYQYIRSGYSSRTMNELPTFSRWLELPLGKPKAEWIVLVLYSKEQIDAEAMIEYEEADKAFFGLVKKAFDEHRDVTKVDQPIKPEPFDAEWGIVSSLGQSHPQEEPMRPETMIRNAGYNTEDYQKEAVKGIRAIWKKAQEPAELVLPEDCFDEDIKSVLSLQGKMVGGSGVPINEEKYLSSIKFWSENCTVK